MVWRVIEHYGYSVTAVMDFETEDDALEYKAELDRHHSIYCWTSIEYCHKDKQAYYSNS